MTVDRLKQVRKLITHANCADGIATALIIRDVMPDVAIEFIKYNSKEHAGLKAEKGLMFIDMTPPRERVQEFVDVESLVCDHHKYAKDIVDAFKFSGIFADEEKEPGVSGAVLALRWVWEWIADYDDPQFDEKYAQILRFASLIGVRDTWQVDSPMWQEANELSTVIHELPLAYWFSTQDPIGAAMALKETLGPKLIQERGHEVKAAFSSQIITGSFGKRRWGLTMGPKAIFSDLAELGRQHGINVLVNIKQVIDDGEVYSLIDFRSDGLVDVGKIATRYGGGGHSKAAGCKMLGSKAPLETFRWIGSLHGEDR